MHERNRLLNGEILIDLSYHENDGDFHVYHGEWLLEKHPEQKGTFLHYNAKIKPLFFAPPILVSFVQRQDLPGILSAHKEHAESAALYRKKTNMKGHAL